MAKKKRRFGRIRRLPSGRYQARYLGPDGIDRPAPHTFETTRDADDWLAEQQTDVRQGGWQAPNAGAVNFKDYALQWVRSAVSPPRPTSCVGHHAEGHDGPRRAVLRACRADRSALESGAHLVGPPLFTGVRMTGHPGRRAR